MASANRVLAGRAVTALIVAIVGLGAAACSHNAAVNGRTSTPASHPATTSALPTPTSFTQQLPDPGRVIVVGETTVTQADSNGTMSVSLAQLSSTARTITLRWTCVGPGVLILALDHTDRVTAACAAATDVIAAAIPLTRHRPRVVVVKAPPTLHWRLSVSES